MSKQNSVKRFKEKQSKMKWAAGEKHKTRSVLGNTVRDY